MSTVQAVQAIKDLAQCIATLRELKVLRSRRFTGDLGEWYARELWGGQLAASQTQPGWDVQSSGRQARVQVKTQSFDPNNRWNYLGSDPAKFDRLVVLVLTDGFEIRTLYDVPVQGLVGVLHTGEEGKPYYYYWDELEPWRVDPRTLTGFSALTDLIHPEAIPGGSVV